MDRCVRLTINLSNGTQKVFNTLCSDQLVHFLNSPGTPDCPFRRSGIWARNGVTYDDVTDRVYFATGNGQFDVLAIRSVEARMSPRPSLNDR